MTIAEKIEPQGERGKFSIEIEGFRALKSGSLHGFVDVVINELKLRIIAAPVHESHGKRWLGSPARPQVDRDGTVRRDERSGKILYVPVLQFTDKRYGDAFGERVIANLLAKWPGAFDNDDATH
jgi:hypothetical protein